MSKLEQQFREDQALRNAAKALLDADIARVRSDLDNKSVGKRAIDRARDGAAEVFDKASDTAGSNRGVLALLVGAIVLWFARNPILNLFFDDEGQNDLTASDGTPSPDAADPPEGDLT